MNDFYLICPVGLEKLVLKEIELKGLRPKIHINFIDKGGIEISTQLAIGLALNKILKTPSRILLRLKKQKCRDFPKLFKIITKTDFHPYIVQEKLEFKVSTSKSRIINTAKAQETCEEAFKKYLQGSAIRANTLKAYTDYPIQKVYLRIVEDELTISLDTSGESLHIRGDKLKSGHAPMRETYASLMITALLEKFPSIDTLIDPMCGSGTFLNEALNYYQINKRNFAYEHWPLARKEDFANTHNEILELYKNSPALFKQLIGFDRDASVLAENNEIKFFKEDLFEGEIKKLENSGVIINPPYGKRVKVSGDRAEFYTKTILRIKEKFNPLVQAMVIPAEVPMSYKSLFEFNNNGIRVKFYLIF